MTVWVGLGSAGGRGTVLNLVNARLEERSGLRVRARDWSLRLAPARLTIEELELARGAEKPIFRADRVEAKFGWRALLAGGPPRIARLTIVGPTLDLTELVRDRSGERGAAMPEFQIDRLELEGGRVLGATSLLSTEARELLEELEVEEIGLHGRLATGGLDLSMTGAAATARAPRLGPPLRLVLNGRIEGDLVEAIRLDRIEMSGPGTTARVSASIGLADAGPAAVEVEAAMDLAQVMPELSRGGHARVTGRADLRSGTADFRVEARELPTMVAEPWLGRAFVARLGEDVSWFDVAGDVSVARRSSEAIHLDAELGWTRAGRRLVSGVARLNGGSFDDSGRFEGASLTGRLELAASDVPAGIARSLIGAEIFDRMAAEAAWLPDSRLGATIRADLPNAPEEPVRGEARFEWRRDRRRLARGEGSFRLARTEPGFDLSDLGAEVELELADVPARLAAALVEPRTLDRWVREDDVVAVAGSMRLRPGRGGSGTPLGGKIEAVWQRGEQAIVRLWAAGSPATGRGAAVRLRAVALPGLVERAEVETTVLAEDRGRLSEATLESGHWQLASGDLGGAVEAIRELWQGLELRGLADRSFSAGGALSAAGELSGALASPSLSGRGSWLPAGERGRAELEASGRPRDLRGSARIRLADFDLSVLSSEASGRLSGSIGVDREEKLTATVELESPRLASADGELELQAVRLALVAGDGVVTVDRFDFEHGPAAVHVRGSGRLPALVEGRLDDLPQPARAEIRVVGLAEGFENLSFEAALAEDRLGLRTLEATTPGGEGRLDAEAPAGAVRRLLEELGVSVAWWPERARSEGVIGVTLEVPELSSNSVLVGMGKAEREEVLTLRELSGRLEIDPARLEESHGSVRAGGASLTLGAHRIETEDELGVELAGGRLHLPATVILADDRRLSAGGSWELLFPDGAPPALGELQLEATGAIDASLLEELIPGCLGEGPIELSGSLRGPLDRLTGDVVVDGEQATVLFPSPYETRFERPEGRLTWADGELRISSANALLNQGELTVAGRITADGEVDLDAAFEGVRYRLDYGLSALLSGQLRWRPSGPDRSTIDGTIVLERGLVRRNIDLTRELRELVLGVAESGSESAERAEAVTLEVDVDTQYGVRVDNNLGDLQLAWTSLRVRGTLAEPLVSGRIDIDPGSVLYAYGQVVRVERGTLRFSGVPGEAPTLDAETTSSLEDPSLRRSGGGDPFVADDAESAAGSTRTAVASGLAGYFGERLASSLGETLLGGAQLQIEPLYLFTESDPDARLTLSQALSRNIAVGVSWNLRAAERRTYLVDLHEFDLAPGLGTQLFTNEEGNEGVTLRHQLELGRGEAQSDRPQVRRIRLPRLDGISAKELRKSLDIESGAPLPDGGLFDLEVEVGDYLRSHGYPEARARARTAPAGGGSAERKRHGRQPVDVVVIAAPGPRVEVEFEGERPPAADRAAIRGLYRSQVAREESLEAMRIATLGALRAQGFVAPQVSVEAAQERPADVERVVIRSIGGDRWALERLELTGLDERSVRYLEARMASRSLRLGLARGEAGAERRFRALLDGLGFFSARLESRSVSEDGRRLRLSVRPGPRRVTGLVTIAGAPEGLSTTLESALDLRTGQSLDQEQLAASAMTLENELRSRGYADARVNAVLGSPEPQTGTTDVRFELEPGKQLRVGGIRFARYRSTKPKWARSMVQIRDDALLRPSELADARRRLLETGIYSAVTIDVQKQSDQDAVVEFGLEERPRYNVGYGLRWENERGIAAVADAADRNFLGRGITLGARVLESSDDRALRLYGALPHAFGARVTLETFAEVRRKVRDGFVTDSREASLQFSRRFGRFTRGRVYGRYRLEDFFEQDPDPFFPIDDRIRSPFAGVQLLYDRRRDGGWGRRGLFGSVDLSGSSPRFGSDFRYLRLFSQISVVETVARLGDRRLDWAQSVRVGWADSFDQVLLQDVRFLAGGEFSVRGYPSESLGPREQLGDVVRTVGGDSLLVINQELRLPLAGRFAGVFLVDAGNVWSGSGFGRDLVLSTGLGLRARTPLGLVRLDFAMPLDRREGDPAFKIYLGLGQVF